MIKPRFLPAAEADLLKEVSYYSNAREGLGIKFHAAVSAAVMKAAASPDSGAPSSKGTRSRLVQGFPFSVVYRAGDSSFLSLPSLIIEGGPTTGRVASLDG